MNIQQFVRTAMERDPRGLGRLPEAKARLAVRAVLGAIAAQIDEAQDGGVVKAPTLGVFRVKIKAAEGEEPAKRRVSFRRVRQAAGGARKSNVDAQSGEQSETAG